MYVYGYKYIPACMHIDIYVHVGDKRKLMENKKKQKR